MLFDFSTSYRMALLRWHKQFLKQNATRILLGGVMSFCVSFEVASSDIATFSNYALTMAKNPAASLLRGSPLTFSIIGSPPNSDRQMIVQSLTSFSWATATTVTMKEDNAADMIFVYQPDYIVSEPGQTILDQMSDKVARQNYRHIKIGGPCTKIITEDSLKAEKSYIFMSLTQSDSDRKNCIYIHVRSAYGIKEIDQSLNFSETFVYDLRVAKCVLASILAKERLEKLVVERSC